MRFKPSGKSPEEASGSPSWAEQARRPGFTLIELLVVIAIVGILVGLLFPALSSVREAARKTQCINNLRQIGLALSGFHSSFRVFPASGWTTAGPGNPAGKYVSWRPLILPYLEQENLRSLYDVNLNWWEGTNPTAASVPVPAFRCPSSPSVPDVLLAIAKPPRPALTFSTPVARTDYEALQGVQPNSVNPNLPSAIYNPTNRFAVMHRTSRNDFAQILDGSSNTVMVVECSARPSVFRMRRLQDSLNNDQGICWADSEGPFSFDGTTSDGSAEGGAGSMAIMNRRNDNEPYSFHAGGANFLFADGHVSFLSESLDYRTALGLFTRAGGEVLNAGDW